MLALLAASWLALPAHVAAQPARVAVFVVTNGAAPTQPLDDVVAFVDRGLHDSGRERAIIEVAPRDVSVKEDLSAARALGSEAFAAIARARDNEHIEEIARGYQARIVSALQLAPFVRDPDGRELLWNLCVLRVQLLLHTGSSADRDDTRRVVRDCRRRFVDQREFSRAWSQDVIDAFATYPNDPGQVQLDVRSVPAGCDVRIYGGLVGMSPLRVNVESGEQEVQLECGTRKGRLRTVIANTSQTVTVRLSADEALEAGPLGTGVLSYATSDGSQRPVDDAAALAAEAGADSFVLAHVGGPETRFEWYERGTLKRARVLPASANDDVRRATLASLFASTEQSASGEPSRPTFKRTWADYTLGVSLVALGAGMTAYAIDFFAQQGDCANAACTRVRDGVNPTSLTLLGVGTAAVTAGALITLIGPFGQRRLTASAGLSSLTVRGTF